jgi:hypothetical protein
MIIYLRAACKLSKTLKQLVFEGLLMLLWKYLKLDVCLRNILCTSTATCNLLRFTDL